MKAITLVFPHQLFEKNPAIHAGRDIVLVEETLFFNQFHFHKHKLAYHRATMQTYRQFLESKAHKTGYIEAHKNHSDIRKLIPYLQNKGVTEIHYVDVTDDWLQKRLENACKKANIELIRYETPMFLNSSEDLEAYFGNKKKYFQADFYSYQRKKLKILVDESSDPTGGKWSFDTENRLKFPKKQTPPDIDFPEKNEIWKEACEYIEKHYPKNYGDIPAEIQFPTDFEHSKFWLRQFLKKRFQDFGKYEDAIVTDQHFLHHSVMTPMLNTGLLTPKYVISETLQFAESENIPINSLEGFVRQIIGWREYMHGVYEFKGSKQRTRNYWEFKRKLPESFWTGETGIEPVDIVIKKVLATGYCHHIERLMVMGNFMLLCEFDPDDVYRWFMELFIDAYDWVMVPNVYGMSQFADGGLLSTKPYISSSNYLLKMSDFPKGDWQEIWDGLFWRFMDKHRNFFTKNPRLGMLIRTFDNLPEEKRKAHLEHANGFLSKLDHAK
ncbi:cryptochrome/photolyase family protein [Dyadobacter luticola]|uniref:Cryptochrome/photolyase family protein n=1 Tax=Dyadobacter luticola TaxID=1979387 RepID=A0A5R9KQ11_9BACT|nr:cryptochrome/photolyase family protein [Dyadobacter luticola]TLU98257.1 cryptochrome/photolyase family protein [Dyadobacter luticola]